MSETAIVNEIWHRAGAKRRWRRLSAGEKAKVLGRLACVTREDWKKIDYEGVIKSVQRDVQKDEKEPKQ